MQNFFGMLWLLSIVGLIIGLIKPSVAIRWGEKRRRKQVLLVYIPLIIVLMILVGSTEDPQKKIDREQQRIAEQQQKVVAEAIASNKADKVTEVKDQVTETVPISPIGAASNIEQPKSPDPARITGSGPNGEGIKGHIDKNGVRIYHLPGDPYYSRTTHVSAWFFTVKDAQAAGYRAIKR